MAAGAPCTTSSQGNGVNVSNGSVKTKLAFEVTSPDVILAADDEIIDKEKKDKKKLAEQDVEEKARNESEKLATKDGKDTSPDKVIEADNKVDTKLVPDKPDIKIMDLDKLENTASDSPFFIDVIPKTILSGALKFTTPPLLISPPPTTTITPIIIQTAPPLVAQPPLLIKPELPSHAPILVSSLSRQDFIPEDSTTSNYFYYFNMGRDISNTLIDGAIDLETPSNQIGIAITDCIGITDGIVEYSNDNGTTWIFVPNAYVSKEHALLFLGTDLLRYTPPLNANGDRTITFHAWDGTGGYKSGDYVDLSKIGVGGSKPFSAEDATETLTIIPVEDESTGTLNVTGEAIEGASLIASLTSVNDVDGETKTSYQWQENKDGKWIDLIGQTSATLSIPKDQSYIDKSVRVVATTTDSLGGTTDFLGDIQVINKDANTNPIVESVSNFYIGPNFLTPSNPDYKHLWYIFYGAELPTDSPFQSLRISTSFDISSLPGVKLYWGTNTGTNIDFKSESETETAWNNIIFNLKSSIRTDTEGSIFYDLVVTSENATAVNFQAFLESISLNYNNSDPLPEHSARILFKLETSEDGLKWQGINIEAPWEETRNSSGLRGVILNGSHPTLYNATFSGNLVNLDFYQSIVSEDGSKGFPLDSNLPDYGDDYFRSLFGDPDPNLFEVSVTNLNGEEMLTNGNTYVVVEAVVDNSVLLVLNGEIPKDAVVSITYNAPFTNQAYRVIQDWQGNDALEGTVNAHFEPRGIIFEVLSGAVFGSDKDLYINDRVMDEPLRIISIDPKNPFIMTAILSSQYNLNPSYLSSKIIDFASYEFSRRSDMVIFELKESTNYKVGDIIPWDKVPYDIVNIISMTQSVTVSEDGIRDIKTFDLFKETFSDGSISLFDFANVGNIARFWGNDYFLGNNSDDKFFGSFGNDILIGGLGNDKLDGSFGNDMLYGGQGDDYLYGGQGDDTLGGYEMNANNIWFYRNSFDSNFYMVPGNNLGDLLFDTANGEVYRWDGQGHWDGIKGEFGNDFLEGGAGIDKFQLSSGVDTINDLGRGGMDILQIYHDGITNTDVTVNALISNENDFNGWIATNQSFNFGIANLNSNGYTVDLSAVMMGNGWTITNASNTGATFEGSKFDDTLNGGSGNDVLNGGDGNDLLTGGDGADIFKFDDYLTRNEDGSASFNKDTILDFKSGQDVIQLDGLVFEDLFGDILNPTTQILDLSQFIIGSEAQTTGQHIIYDPNSGALYYDKDGSANQLAIQFAEVTPGITITSSDFIINMGG